MGLLQELRRAAISAIPAIPEVANSRDSGNSRESESQLRVARVCKVLALPFEEIAPRIDFSELAACDERVLTAYVRALAIKIERESGIVPSDYTVPAHCEGCGPVWLWPGAERVLACPWCWNRRAQLPIPRPSEET